MPRMVLVVEDSPAMRGMIASIVDQIEATEVVEVAGGYEALKMLPRHRFALIITDINMPDINGLELVAYIRKSPGYEGVPTIVVTSEGSPTDRERAMALGANAFLLKPFSPDELMGTAERLLDA